MMKIKGLLFDLNGTVIDILTNEADDQLFRVCANFLDYYGVHVPHWKLKELFFELNHKQRHESKEEFPEFDVIALFAEIMQKIFGHGHITLNSKNIEYKEEYMLSDYGMDADLEARLSKFKFADILIGLTIYRLGSYSYFNVEVDYMREDHRYSIR